MKTKSILLLTTSLIAGSFNAALASTIVSWGGDYVSANQNFNLGTLTTATVYSTDDTLIRPYSATTALSPLSSYTVPSGKSGTFYGAMQASGENTTPTGFQGSGGRVDQNTNGDQLRFTGVPTTTGSGDTSTLKGFTAFLKADFLGGLNAAPAVSFDASSSLSLNMPSSGNTNFIRMAVLDGSQWYLSESARTTHVAGTFTLNDPNSVNWATWTPSTSGLFNAAPTTFSIVGSDFDDIQGVGFYFEAQRDGSANAPVFIADSFTVTAIPEPGTYALLLGLVGLTSIVIRRRRS